MEKQDTRAGAQTTSVWALTGVSSSVILCSMAEEAFEEKEPAETLFRVTRVREFGSNRLLPILQEASAGLHGAVKRENNSGQK